MRIRKANQKKIGSANCAKRREFELTITGVKLSYDM